MLRTAEEATDEVAFSIMAKDFAKGFYKTQNWKKTRAAYLSSVGGLCERCLARGLIVPAAVVHHRVYIDETNINDPTVVLDWHNLEALCASCHANEHQGTDRRYSVDEYGRVTVM